MSLIFDDRTSANVKTLQDTELLVLLKTSFKELIDTNHELKKEFEFIAEKRKFKVQK